MQETDGRWMQDQPSRTRSENITWPAHLIPEEEYGSILEMRERFAEKGLKLARAKPRRFKELKNRILALFQVRPSGWHYMFFVMLFVANDRFTDEEIDAVLFSLKDEGLLEPLRKGWFWRKVR